MSKPKTRKKSKGGRLHIRIDEGLAKEMHAYIARNDTTLTAVTSALFRNLLAEEKRAAMHPETDQI